MGERQFLQIAVAVAGLVPVVAGALGAIWPELLIGGPTHGLAHAAYLSGLLLGTGLAFWSLIPDIERRGAVFGLLTGLVLLGGLARAFTALRLSAWNLSVTLPLVMELGVAPALYLWQRRVSFLLPPE